jgi:hypothetical protein
MIEKRIAIDLIQILEDGTMQIREATIIEEDGVELSRTFHRRTKTPNAVKTDADPRVQSIATTVWTQPVIDAYENKISQQGEK